jgi:hypothetical protein
MSTDARMLGLLGVLVALGAAILSTSGSSGSSDGPSPPPDPPAPGDPWGAASDLAAAGMEPAGPRPGVHAFRRWVLSTRGGRDGGIVRDPSIGNASEHHDSRAWDWMIDVGGGRALVEELLADDARKARAAGILYLIHDRRMWRGYPWQGAPPGTWSAYGGTSPHVDHLHVSFTRAGARGDASAYRAGGELARFVEGGSVA